MDLRPGALPLTWHPDRGFSLRIAAVPAGWLTATRAAAIHSDADSTAVLAALTVTVDGSDLVVTLPLAAANTLGRGTWWWRLQIDDSTEICGPAVGSPSPTRSTSGTVTVVTQTATVTVTVLGGGTGGGGVTDHGALTGLADDDHAQYLTSGRHSAIAGNPHGTTAAQVGADPAGSAAAAQAASQPLDSDLTAIAALTTTAFGRGLLTLANAGALLTASGGEAAGTAAAVVAAHEADTTNVHGIVNTAALVLTGDARLSDARTPTAHAASHADGGADEISIDASQVTSGALSPARLPDRFARSTADQSWTSTTAYGDVAGVSVALAANATYWVQVLVSYSASQAGDVKAQLVNTGGGTWSTVLDVRRVGTGAGAATTVHFAQPVTALGAGVAAGGPDAAANTSQMSMLLTGWVVTDGTPGDLRLQAAQNVSDAVATIVRAGTALVALQVA